MKESIYTIPINDAFDANCSCPLCFIYNNLENELVEMAVGAAMMEPDHRENSDNKGLCKNHANLCYEQQKVLPLALVLQTFTAKQNKNMAEIINNTTVKKSFLKSQTKLVAENLANYIEQMQDNCYICEKLDNMMLRYIENTIYMWKTKPEFKEKFNSKPYFCINHYGKLLNVASKELNNSLFDEFFNVVTDGLNKTANDCYNNISDFAKAFDYRFKGELSQDAKNSIPSIISKYFFK